MRQICRRGSTYGSWQCGWCMVTSVWPIARTKYVAVWPIIFLGVSSGFLQGQTAHDVRVSEEKMHQRKELWRLLSNYVAIVLQRLQRLCVEAVLHWVSRASQQALQFYVSLATRHCKGDAAWDGNAAHQEPRIYRPSSRRGISDGQPAATGR